MFDKQKIIAMTAALEEFVRVLFCRKFGAAIYFLC